jgi:predicted transcriptional regulator
VGISADTSTNLGGVIDRMATVKQLRLKARLSIQGLGRLANVDTKTIRRAEDGLPIQELKAVAIVEALGQALGQELSPRDVDDLHIYGES